MGKRKLQKAYSIKWAIWVVHVAVSFAIIEGFALHSPEGGDTLSEHVWALQEHYGSIFYAMLYGGAVWGLWHFSIFEKARRRLGPTKEEP
jgi:hypothetical protein